MTERKKANCEEGIRIGLSYEVEVRDKEGKLLSKCKGKSDPFTRAWIQLLRAIFLGNDAQVSLADTGGVSRTFAPSELGGYSGQVYDFAETNAGSTVDAYGVMVGGSDLAFSRTQYNLQSKIAHGSGSGQLLYGATTIEDYVDEDTTTRIRMIRAFSNTSGASVTVREIGIAIRHRSYTTALLLWYLLVARDVLPSPQTVPDGATLTVRYRLFISYA